MPEHHSSQYVSVPNQLGSRSSRTSRIDADVFEETGLWVPPQDRSDDDGLLFGLDAGEVSLGLTIAFIAWRIL